MSKLINICLESRTSRLKGLSHHNILAHSTSMVNKPKQSVTLMELKILRFWMKFIYMSRIPAV